MIVTQQLANNIREIAIFCLSNKGRCFKDWNGNKVFSFIAFHLFSGGLLIHRENGEIKSVGICWTSDAEEIIRRDKAGEPEFDWTIQKSGNALFISQVFGSRAYCDMLWKMALEKWPNVTRFFAYRLKDGKAVLKEFDEKTISAFCGRQYPKLYVY
jgi:hypothetical protein